jgi:hypothetical protein
MIFSGHKTAPTFRDYAITDDTDQRADLRSGRLPGRENAGRPAGAARRAPFADKLMAFPRESGAFSGVRLPPPAPREASLLAPFRRGFGRLRARRIPEEVREPFFPPGIVAGKGGKAPGQVRRRRILGLRFGDFRRRGRPSRRLRSRHLWRRGLHSVGQERDLRRRRDRNLPHTAQSAQGRRRHHGRRRIGPGYRAVCDGVVGRSRTDP